MLDRYLSVRRTTEGLCSPLATEDYVLQAMPDVSPTRWHLAHTTWFFETFVLERQVAGYRPLDERYRFLFNSYYNSVGPQFPRAARGHLSRPTVDEVYAYRAHVDKAMADLLETRRPDAASDLGAVVLLGINHEQQHQELILTDLKYNLGVNPLLPAYQAREIPRRAATALEFVGFEGGLVRIGHEGSGFAFDNEVPRHPVWLEPYRLASRPITSGEYVEFIDAGGYTRPELWLSDGWNAVRTEGWQAPLHWHRVDGGWAVFTLSGLATLDEHAPVVHVSYHEADAFARFRGKRLPTEPEWEHAAAALPLDGNLMESGLLHPVAAGPDTGGLRQITGDVWEWTQSPYAPYPGFKPLAGGLGEYNGKFMVNQLVLRGGSCATPRSHLRVTYRNFFPPTARWQFSGIRLAEDA
jgi:ergothioneine biosynthesis protein EgtB